jgi:hypothetical protein
MTRDPDRIAAGEADDLLDGEPVPAEEREAARRMARLVGDLVDRRTARTESSEERSLLDAAAILRTAARRELFVAEVLAAGSRRKQRWRRRAPWLGLTAIVATAGIALVLLRPPSSIPSRDGATAIAVRDADAERLRSRPADALIGRIDEADAGKARERMDRIVADRMAGYRQVMLGRGGAR